MSHISVVGNVCQSKIDCTSVNCHKILYLWFNQGNDCFLYVTLEALVQSSTIEL